MRRRERVRGFVVDNALSLVFGLLFLGSLVGQALAGWAQLNNNQHAEGLGKLTLGQYLTSADFAVDVTENWQSEYLQFLVYVMLTIWLVQKGSTESKKPGQEGPETDAEQKVGWHAPADAPAWANAGSWRTWVFSWSLFAMMAAIFLDPAAHDFYVNWAEVSRATVGALRLAEGAE